jgi:hypothetical protein
MPFSQTTRALSADRSYRSIWGILLIVALLGAWGGWLTLARMPVYERSATGQIKGQRIIANFPVAALERIQTGQPARITIDGFPSLTYGTLPATVTAVANTLRDGRFVVELSIKDDAEYTIPLQHGMTVLAAVEVDHVSPMALFFTSLGQRLAPGNR